MLIMCEKEWKLKMDEDPPLDQPDEDMDDDCNEYISVADVGLSLKLLLLCSSPILTSPFNINKAYAVTMRRMLKKLS